MSGVFGVKPFLFRGRWGVVKEIEFRTSCVPGKSSVMEIQLQPPPHLTVWTKLISDQFSFYLMGQICSLIANSVQWLEEEKECTLVLPSH